MAARYADGGRKEQTSRTVVLITLANKTGLAVEPAGLSAGSPIPTIKSALVAEPANLGARLRTCLFSARLQPKWYKWGPANRLLLTPKSSNIASLILPRSPHLPPVGMKRYAGDPDRSGNNK